MQTCESRVTVLHFSIETSSAATRHRPLQTHLRDHKQLKLGLSAEKKTSFLTKATLKRKALKVEMLHRNVCARAQGKSGSDRMTSESEKVNYQSKK